MRSQIFLDLDGVIIDFHTAALAYFALDETYTVDDINSWHKIIELTGLSETEFWNGLDETFWLSLKLTPWANSLLQILKPYKPCLLTCPSHNNAGARQEWIKLMLPDYFYSNRYLIGPGKEYVARPGAILIDDSDRNVEKWKAEGGSAWTFPRPWNKGVLTIKQFITFLPNAIKFSNWEGIE